LNQHCSAKKITLQINHGATNQAQKTAISPGLDILAGMHFREDKTTQASQNQIFQKACKKQKSCPVLMAKLLHNCPVLMAKLM